MRDNMKVLLIGSGGREHALAWAIAASPLLEKLWIAPGNPGTAQCGENIPTIAIDDPIQICNFAAKHAVDIVVIGPEAPLVHGIVDILQSRGIRCFGPSRSAARLEGEKSYLKNLCSQYNIPTAQYQIFDDPVLAHAYVKQCGAPIVIKADGLAAGKGVVVATNIEDAHAAIDSMLKDRAFGSASARIIIEEVLVGNEVSYFALCDGKTALPFASAQDHKRAFEGDTGPNTGGMGAYSPAMISNSDELKIQNNILYPLLDALLDQKPKIEFKGVLFLGLMMCKDGPKLIECNVRFGDPETQALIMRLKSDLLTAMISVCDQALDHFDLRWSDKVSLSLVMAAKGYPDQSLEHGTIIGSEQFDLHPDIKVFHASSAYNNKAELVSTGGRVLSINVLADTFSKAQEIALQAAKTINWPQGFYRKDIAWQAIAQETATHQNKQQH